MTKHLHQSDIHENWHSRIIIDYWINKWIASIQMLVITRRFGRFLSTGWTVWIIVFFVESHVLWRKFRVPTPYTFERKYIFTFFRDDPLKKQKPCEETKFNLICWLFFGFLNVKVQLILNHKNVSRTFQLLDPPCRQ